MSLAFLDGQPATADDLRALALANYGHFSSMQVRGRAVRGFDLHLQRLKAATRELFDQTLDEARIRSGIISALDAAGMDDAGVRVTVFSRAFDSLRPDRSVPVDVLASLSPAREAATTPAWVKTFAFQRPLPHVKHVGTFPLFQWRRQALRDGFDDALFVDARGRISEGSVWNIGFWDGEQVVWPQAEALRGTQEKLLQAGLAEVGVAQRHMPVEARALGGLKAAFAANATGVWPLSGIDDLALRPDPVLMERLRAALQAAPLRSL
ncbi:aminotransferase class IV family protein [Luteimonas kalidii]|uniref:Aminotransferase class IV family protein n=1 Tax=Luteimonas kalidii TaxID=3042025 RepID=A0ABT6JTF7_9GAMM|nr:aminotransferase class IV family protein [Luteimonas kalidii]MDH5833958.1 aminotransferase class IV family protein [Luteimonas kalidii]